MSQMLQALLRANVVDQETAKKIEKEKEELRRKTEKEKLKQISGPLLRDDNES